MSVKQLKCEICGTEISASNFSKHMRRHRNHPETFENPSYKLNHEGLVCQFCGKECKNRNSLCNHERLCKENPKRQILHPIKNKEAWNKGLTKETDDRIRKACESYEINEKQGKHNHKYGQDNPSSKREVKEKISKTCLGKALSGKWHKSLAKNKRYNYNGVELDGPWELAYAVWLDSKHIVWRRCFEIFTYFYQGKIRSYTPDFYLSETDEYIEIKGYQTPKDEAKWQYFPKDKTLKILKGKDLKELGVI